MGVALSYSSLVAEGVLDETPKKREREREYGERERGLWREGGHFEDSYDIIPITIPLLFMCVFSIISIILSGLLWTGCELRS
jgi:hypothetical protein